MYKVFFITFGCKVSQYETECLKSCFLRDNFALADSESEADVFVVNSCTVTGSGDSKSLYKVRKLRRDYPESVIVLTGCLPQASPETAGNCAEADIVTGTKERDRLPTLVSQIIDSRSRIVDIPEYSSGDIFEDISCESTCKTRAFLKIQDGCNCFCSYCIIPYARGRCRSKPVESLIKEAVSLAESGHREIVLVGINLAFYGQEYGLRLVDAVEECCKIEGIERVRLGSLEPEMISDDDLLRLSRQPKFCPQFHLSLQSGSRRTLRNMNRKYTSEEYMTLVEKIRRIFPEASFTTDVMVGFPQETEEDFVESLDFVREVGFAKIHVFQYSPRKGTVASKLSGQIPKNIKAERADRMKSLGDELQKKYLASLVGKTVPVLFERENSDDFHQGHAPDYTLIKILRKNSKKSLRNQIFYVIIEESHDDYCLGKILD
ncbi:MAG: tRNA (N(6)-L-threonylcarbamoyladenosine(37)-C(2))-methylthiotransferase MtaB [Ruminococcus flavefaciens]|nr:tRNA (N(6)-L-threonylcarbamoyladenosine(37)-C(2))-methylthiotransferase MtaB [Ruminococcus flavefaciens]MCM1229639.1 tRNA (N(6)-L-threonylcarbamoyladenosine(37)-C(2))-methylthiotransferase MtaB [Ruminococcus flavefaciens]